MYSLLLILLIHMKRNDIFTIIIKVLIYILTLLLGYVGASALTSCASADKYVRYRGVIVVQDTIVISNHGYK